MCMNSNVTPPQDNAGAAARSAGYAKRRKIVKIILIVFAVIIVLYVATMWLNPDELVDRWFSDDNTSDLPPQNIEFYPADKDYNIMADEEYLEYDRRISYYDPDSGATYWVEEEEVDSAEPFVKFFHSYFQTVIYGDALNYAEHFSLAYEGELPEDFTMQMVYDIELRPHANANGEMCYIVNYKIHKNNGTFRRDIGSDVGREYLFTLVEEGNRLLIVGMRPYTSY